MLPVTDGVSTTGCEAVTTSCADVWKVNCLPPTDVSERLQHLASSEYCASATVMKSKGSSVTVLAPDSRAADGSSKWTLTRPSLPSRAVRTVHPCKQPG